MYISLHLFTALYRAVRLRTQFETISISSISVVNSAHLFNRRFGTYGLHIVHVRASLLSKVRSLNYKNAFQTALAEPVNWRHRREVSTKHLNATTETCPIINNYLRSKVLIQ